MATIGKVNSGLSGERLIFPLPPGTLVKWREYFCIRNWAGMGTLDGNLWWNNETLEKIMMCGEVLPSGTVIEVIQK
jgi:hypothetical protein